MAQVKKATKTKTEEKKQLKEIIEAEEAVIDKEAAELVAVKAKAEAVVETVAVDAVPEVKMEIEKEAPTAKAGKRSVKATKEAEQKAAKEARKVSSDSDSKAGDPKPVVKVAKTRAERAGKNYRKAAELIDRSKTYKLSEALELAAKTNPVKFDATVELHLNLGVDPKQADQNIRDTVALPAGTGKTVRIAVIAEPDDAKKAKAAGADITDSDQIFADLDKENIEFDVLICVPQMMAKLGKYARMLGPRGLMPNPKSGTVTANVVTAVSEAKAGRVEYRVDQAGIVHLAIGKVSFTPPKLLENAEAVMASIRAAKPASVKGIYLKSGYVTSSMGPSIKFEV